MGVALKVQDRVHHVFQHTRPGQRAFFGDVTDQDDRGAGGLGHARQMRRTLAHLRHRTRRTGELIGVNRLDGIHHHHRRLQLVDGGQYFFQLGFGQHLHLAVVQPQAPRTQRDLGARLFAGHVQSVQAAALKAVHGL